MRNVDKVLFRGKSVKTGEWVYGGLTREINPLSDAPRAYVGDVIINRDPDTGEDNFELKYLHEVKPKTVCEWTGIKDKNGNPIFEGDAIKAYGENYIVSMSGLRCGWYPFACGDGCGCCEEDVINPINCEVIANIIDEPEIEGWAKHD